MTWIWQTYQRPRCHVFQYQWGLIGTGLCKLIDKHGKIKVLKRRSRGDMGVFKRVRHQ